MASGSCRRIRQVAAPATWRGARFVVLGAACCCSDSYCDAPDHLSVTATSLLRRRFFYFARIVAAR